MNINNYNQFLKLVGRRHKEVRIAFGYYDQGKYDMFFTGKEKNTSRISRIENGHNILFSQHSILAYKLKVPLYSLYDFDNVYGFIQTTSKVSQDEWVKIDASIFGTQLKNLRVKKGMTILDLEIASGISSSNISNYENAQKDFKLNTYNKLAQGLEVQHVELMFDPSNPILLHSIGI